MGVELQWKNQPSKSSKKLVPTNTTIRQNKLSDSIFFRRITDQQKKVEDGVSGRAGQIEGLLKQLGNSGTRTERNHHGGGTFGCRDGWKHHGMLPRMYAGYVGYVGCWLFLYLFQAIIFEKGYISFSFVGPLKSHRLRSKASLLSESQFFSCCRCLDK